MKNNKSKNIWRKKS